MLLNTFLALSATWTQPNQTRQLASFQPERCAMCLNRGCGYAESIFDTFSHQTQLNQTRQFASFQPKRGARSFLWSSRTSLTCIIMYHIFAGCHKRRCQDVTSKVIWRGELTVPKILHIIVFIVVMLLCYLCNYFCY